MSYTIDDYYRNFRPVTVKVKSNPGYVNGGETDMFFRGEFPERVLMIEADSNYELGRNELNDKK